MNLQTCLVEVLEYVEVKEVVGVGLVCKPWARAIEQAGYWRRQCRDVWGLVPEKGESPSTAFGRLASRFWKYRSCYARVVDVWNRFKSWMKSNSPRMLDTLLAGASEETLQEVEARIGLQLPLELRCFYAIHEGQGVLRQEREMIPNLDGMQVDEWREATGLDYHVNCLGLLGGWSVYNEHVSLLLLPLAVAAQDYTRIVSRCEHARGRLTIARNVAGRMSQNLFLNLEDTQDPHRPLFGLCYSGGGYVTSHVAGHSFVGYVKTLVDRLEQGVYRARLGEIQLFPCGNALGATTTTTNGVTIEASPLMIPCNSNDVEMYTYAYRLTLKADKPCQLNMRTWACREDPAQPFTEMVHAKAVVGYHPILTPDGTEWEYASVTRNRTNWGQMGGSLSFVPNSLAAPDGPEFEATIDPMTLHYSPESILESTKW